MRLQQLFKSTQRKIDDLPAVRFAAGQVFERNENGEKRGAAWPT